MYRIMLADERGGDRELSVYYFRNCLRRVWERQRKTNNNNNNYTYTLSQSQVGEIINDLCARSHPVTVKEEVDLIMQNRGLFVSTTSEAFFRFFIAISWKRKKDRRGKERGISPPMPFRCREDDLRESQRAERFSFPQMIFFFSNDFSFFPSCENTLREYAFFRISDRVQIYLIWNSKVARKKKRNKKKKNVKKRNA